MAVTSNAGVKQGTTYKWDPDGMPIASTIQPNLTTGNYENGWLGIFQRMTDTTDPANPVINMGARVYLPRLAKFTSPDPVEGRVGDADYLYPPDSINGYDLSGRKHTDEGSGSWGYKVCSNLTGCTTRPGVSAYTDWTNLHEWVAENGDDISLTAEGVSVICGGAAIVSAPSGVGAVGFGACAGIAGGISTVAVVSRAAVCALTDQKGKSTCSGASSDLALEVAFVGYGSSMKLAIKGGDKVYGYAARGSKFFDWFMNVWNFTIGYGQKVTG